MRNVLLVLVLTAELATPPYSLGQGGNGFQVTANPINEPDKFAWQLFAEINRSAQDGTQNTIWETWASDQDLYGDPNATPVWNNRQPNVMRLKPITQFELLDQQLHRQQPANFIPGQGGGEEVRINKAAFDFIVLQQLWYLEGQVQAFQAKKRVDFPIAAREIKAVWMPIRDADKPKYHWQHDSTDGKTYGLIALHVISKDPQLDLGYI